jgi:hypothetical protein
VQNEECHNYGIFISSSKYNIGKIKLLKRMKTLKAMSRVIMQKTIVVSDNASP